MGGIKKCISEKKKGCRSKHRFKPYSPGGVAGIAHGPWHLVRLDPT